MLLEVSLKYYGKKRAIITKNCVMCDSLVKHSLDGWFVYDGTVPWRSLANKFRKFQTKLIDKMRGEWSYKRNLVDMEGIYRTTSWFAVYRTDVTMYNAMVLVYCRVHPFERCEMQEFSSIEVWINKDNYDHLSSSFLKL